MLFSTQLVFEGVQSPVAVFAPEKDERNYGPTAQNFYNLFGKDKKGEFGSGKKIIEMHLTSVGMAALKGYIAEIEKADEKLNDVSNEQKEILNEIEKLEKEVIELEKRYTKMKEIKQ